MALDGAFLYAVKNELQPLIGGRIEKIHQPSREEVIISIRIREGSKKLFISANASSARVHVTARPVDNPQTPPMFCMLLRKRLGSGKLIAVRYDDNGIPAGTKWEDLPSNYACPVCASPKGQFKKIED